MRGIDALDRGGAVVKLATELELLRDRGIFEGGWKQRKDYVQLQLLLERCAQLGGDGGVRSCDVPRQT
jgi:hypothetical protein